MRTVYNMRNKKICITIIILMMLSITVAQAIPVEGENASVVNNKLDQFLTKLDVQEKFKVEINKLITDGYSQKDVMITYTFLNDRYGKLEDLKPMLEKKKNGGTWESIFNDFMTSNDSFVPRNFDFEKLDSMMQSSITMDDIMIADRISFVSGKDFDTILYRKIEGESFKKINEELGILTSQSKLPIIKMTNDKTKYYMDRSKLTQDQVIRGCVLANKFNKEPMTIIDYIKAGYSEAKIYEVVYSNMY